MPPSDEEIRARWHGFWDELVARMKAAGDQVVEETANTLDRDEGLRVILRDLRYSLERDVEELDRQHPVFSQSTRDLYHIFIDAPDYGIFDARISGNCTYRITGRLGAAADITFMVMGNDPDPRPVPPGDDVGEVWGALYKDSGPAPRHMTGFIGGADLVTDADGQFEIHVGPQPPALGNWLRTDAGTDIVIVRNIFHSAYQEHRRYQPARLWIECIGAAERPDAYRTGDLLAGMAKVLQGAGTASTSRSVVARRIARSVVNAFSGDERFWKRTGSNPRTTFHEGYWRLGPDQALLIEARDLPQTTFWSLGLGAYWMESLDFRFHRVNVNSHSVTCGSDDSVRIVIANTDPGVPNWLDAAGHEHGVMLWRWNDPSRLPELPRTALVPLRGIAGHPSLFAPFR